MTIVNLNKELTIVEFARLMVLDQSLKIKTVENMKSEGGSFVQALSNCALMADPNNLRRLTICFFEYFIEYAPKEWETQFVNVIKFQTLVDDET